ncbi:hypothetical protein M0765_026545 [Variovorax sp. S2]|uniref:hypothetical protein n=1 Tax=Variovorax sp. S12S4 TaxID=3029170 RepID=UPI00215C4593|nr:hypothetical protein [Variovorax sp. S12S4]MCR8961159.1 hypothetical protein [Variovorax sp. S12S4]
MKNFADLELAARLADETRHLETLQRRFPHDDEIKKRIDDIFARWRALNIKIIDENSEEIRQATDAGNVAVAHADATVKYLIGLSTTLNKADHLIRALDRLLTLW